CGHDADISSLNHDFLMRNIVGRLSGQMLQYSVHNMVRHERLAIVFPNVSIDGKTSFTPKISEKLPRIVVFHNDGFLGARQNINDVLSMKRNNPLDVKVIGYDAYFSELFCCLTDNSVS